MSKPSKLKSWYTIAGAAQRLSDLYEEPVTESDILQFALSGQLRLSVDFVNHASARVGAILTWSETDWELRPDEGVLPDPDGFLKRTYQKMAEEMISANEGQVPDKLRALLAGLHDTERSEAVPRLLSMSIGAGRFVTLSEDIETLREIWDLPLIGAERIDIEHMYHGLNGGPSVDTINLEGAFVQSVDGMFIGQIQERYGDEFERKLKEVIRCQFDADDGGEVSDCSEDADRAGTHERKDGFSQLGLRISNPLEYFPAPGIPTNCALGVRSNALREFERLVNGEDTKKEKPLATKERNTLLTLIAALCHNSSIEYVKFGKGGAVSQLEKMTHNIEAPIDQDTIRTHLKAINDAVERRKR